MKTLQIALLFALALLMGCHKLEFQSKLREGYSQRIDKVCIVVTHPFDKDPNPTKLAREALQAGFTARGIQTSVLAFEGTIAADQAMLRPGLSSAYAKVDVALLQKNSGFRPSYLLRFNLGSTGTRFYTHGSTGIYPLRNVQLSLTELESGQVIWKAELCVKDSIGMTGDFLDMAELTLQQLEKDGLLKASGKS